MSQRKRPKVGDVIRIATANGWAYAQFTRRDPMLGCMIRVLPGLYPAPLEPADLTRAVAAADELYYTFVFPQDFDEPPTVSVVANEPVPERCRAYPLFRDGTRDPRTKRLEAWWLWDGTKSWQVGPLTEELRRLPVREIWNFKILADRVGSGWTPAEEV
ncbi:MAG TPA: hypothetical protein VK986_14285 [Tepidisphaeraceae bacterium]|nr:hypothetical protein [Tepidisphaeraceae bacterium]